MRVDPANEEQTTRELNPELAEELGDTMGMIPTETWKVLNVSQRTTRGELIKILGTPTLRWQGWLACPKHTLKDRNLGRNTWVVETDSEPPSRALKCGPTFLTFEKYIDI